MQLEWHGYYLDGRTASRQQAALQLMPTALRIATESGATLWWPYDEIRQTQGFYAGEQVRLERGGEIAEALLVSDPEFLTSLHRLVPGLKRRFHDPSRRHLRARLTFLAAVAAIGLTLALYLWGIPLMTALVAARVPVAWEERLGQAVTEHLAPAEKRCTDTTQSQMIDKILTTLTRPLSKSPYSFRVVVVNDPAVNAFAAPGGYIVLLQGLLEKTQTAEELAGVLAHELQHILQRHATRMLLQHVSTGLLLIALTGDTSGTTGYGLESARTLGVLRYSRQSEEAADVAGMALLLAAQIDPDGMITFLEGMRHKSGELPRALAYLSTHPTTEERIEKLRSLARLTRPRPIKLLRDYDWRDIKKICATISERAKTQGR